jgi:hypothetical protein
MKAINLHQPWAELIISGKKKIELRKTRISHRGILGIRATNTVLDGECRKHNLKGEDLVTGAIIGTVELVDVIPMDNQNWRELREHHLVDLPTPGPWKFGWRLENPIRLTRPIAYRGMPGMFELADEIAEQIAQEISVKHNQ